MNKFILALTFILLMPFFSSANIFEDGNIALYDAEKKATFTYSCDANGDVITYSFDKEMSLGVVASKCFDDKSDGYIDEVASSFCSSGNGSYKGSNSGYSKTVSGNTASSSFWFNCENSGGTGSFIARAFFDSKIEIENCPSLENPNSTYSVPNTTPQLCAVPSEVTANDTCDFNDVYSNPVTESAACISKSDGSQCAVSAVALPDSSESVYMPTENDCYSDVYPILDENGGIGNMPDGSDQQCTESGALSYCPADPSEVCPNGVCDAGCGNMNGTFVCIAPLEPPDVPCTGDDCGEGETPTPCTGDDVVVN